MFREGVIYSASRELAKPIFAEGSIRGMGGYGMRTRPRAPPTGARSSTSGAIFSGKMRPRQTT
jgi:hypothetical protein